MDDFTKFLNEQLKDENFKKEYDTLEPEFMIIQAIIDERKRLGMTQKELSQKTGITQSDISKIENGNANPSLRTLTRIALGFGKKVKVQFV